MWRAGFRSVVARWTCTSRASHGSTRRRYRAAPQLRAPSVPKLGPQGMWNGALRGSNNQVLRVDAIRYLSAVSTEGSVDHQNSAVNLTRFCEEGRLNDALETVETMAEQGVDISPALLSRIADECLKRKSLAYGKRLHSAVTRKGLELGSIGWNTLIRLYAACGSLEDAEKAFRMIVEPAEYSWQAIILAHANLEHGKKAIELYKEMQESGVKPNSHIYVAVLKACASTTALVDGREVHDHVIESGLESHEIVANALMNMYAKCGSMAEARKLFDGLAKRDVLAWTVMITGYTEHGSFKEALELFEEMKGRGVEPNKITFLNILKACANTGALDEGRQIHSQIAVSGLATDVSLGNSLISMYCKCRSLQEGKDVFDRMRHKTIVSWNALIGGYGLHGQSQEAFLLFEELQQQGLQPNNITFLSVLRALDGAQFLEQGKEIHAQLIRHGLELDAAIGSALVDMYAKCGSLDQAKQVFDSLVEKDAVAWAAMIRVHEEQGKGDEALRLYKEMQGEGIEPNRQMYLHALKACSSTAALQEGTQINARITDSGLELDVEVGSTLVDMYVKCGDLERAQALFETLPEKNAVAWDSLIAGYAQHDQYQKVSELFVGMLQQGIRPSAGTYASILKASDKSLDQVKQIEAQVIEAGFEVDVNLGNALIDVYAKSGNLEEARQAFDKLPEKNTASFNALMGGYIQHERYQEAIDVWRDMRDEKISEPDRATFVNIFKACTKAAGLAQGRFAHLLMVKMGIEIDEEVGILLIDMYSECGRLTPAKDVFEKLQTKNVEAWDALISGHTKLAKGDEALQLLVQMKEQGVQPEASTVIRVLNACSHAEMIYEGWRLFDSLTQDYGVDPTPGVCASMVGLLGRAGYLEVAEEFIDKLVPNPDVDVWTVLLRACRNYGDAEMGKRAFDSIIELEPTNTDAHIIMANLYAKCNMPTEEAQIKEKMQELGLKHKPGRTFVEVEYNVSGFFVDDQSHHLKHDIYSQLWRLAKGCDELDQPRRRVGFKT